MEYILLPLIEHIAEGMPQLSLVDEDYGQLEVIDEEGKEMYPITYPAVLIDLEQVDWSEVAGKSQMGEARLKIRLIIDCYDDTHASSGTLYRIQERGERADAHREQVLYGQPRHQDLPRDLHLPNFGGYHPSNRVGWRSSVDSHTALFLGPRNPVNSLFGASEGVSLPLIMERSICKMVPSAIKNSCSRISNTAE